MPPLRANLPRDLAASALLLILLFYIHLQFKNFVPAYSEPDLDAYLWLTKRIATLQPLAVPNSSPFHFQEHMWVQTPSGLITTKFAPGNSLLMAPFYLLFGDRGPFLVPSIAGTLTLLGAYLLFRRWMGRFPSLIAVVVITFNPIFLMYSGYILTHSVDLCLITLGMLFLFCYLERPSASAAIGAGLCLGFAVTVRYPNIILALPLFAVLVISLFRKPPRPILPSILLLAAYSIFPLLLLIYNDALFGNPFLTGYALSNEQNGFSLAMLTTNYSLYLEGALRFFLFLTLPLGALGAITLGPWKQRTTRLLWIIPLLLLYMAYYWFAPRLINYRFILALLPVFVGCAYAFIDHVQASRWARYTAMILLAALTLYHDETWIHIYTSGRSHIGFTTQVDAAKCLTANLKPDAVVFTQNNLSHYISQQKHFDLYNLSAFHKDSLRYFPEDRVYSIQDATRGQVPPRMQPSRLAFFFNFYENTTERQFRKLKLDIIQNALDHHQQVAFFLSDYMIEAENNALKPRCTLKPLAKITLSMYDPYSDSPPQKEDWQLLEVVPIEEPAPPPPQTFPSGPTSTIFSP